MVVNKEKMEEPVALDPNKKWKLDKKLWSSSSRSLEEYVGKPIALIREEYYRDIQGAAFAKQKQIDQNSSKELVAEYYKSCTIYLYELSFIDASLEMQREHRKVERFLRKSRLKKILEFGGGVGGFSAFIRQRGYDVTYFDVEGNTSRFAEWRFRQLGLNIPTVYRFDDLAAESFEVIHSTDCLEHVPDLENIFETFSLLVKRDGFFIFKATFHGGGIHLRENEKYHDINILTDTLNKYGFEFRGQLKDDRLSFNLNKVIPCYWMMDVYVEYRKKLSGNYLVFQKKSQRLPPANG